MATYLKRNDFAPLNPDSAVTRNYLVKSVEASTPALLATAINTLLLTAPDLLPGNVAIEIVDIDYMTTGTGGNTKYIAFITVYFQAFTTVTQFGA